MAEHVFKAGNYEGALGLLLKLVHDNKVNIYDIPIAEITDQFLNYLDNLKETDLEDLSEFYSLAAKLIYIKSRMMLPQESDFDDDDWDFDDDPRQELVEKLIEYQKFRKLSELMEKNEDISEWRFERRNIERYLPKEERTWEKVDSAAVLGTLQRVYKSLMKVVSDTKILDVYEEISVNEKITLMTELMRKTGFCMFSELLTRVGNPLDMVCAFMAVLEAVKFRIIVIYQNRLFEDIKICPREKENDYIEDLKNAVGND